MMPAEQLSQVAWAVCALDPERTAAAVEAALRAGARPVDIVDEGIARGMEAVGEQYLRSDVFLPELLMAEQCMRRGLRVIESGARPEDASLVDAARQSLANRAASWVPALSSCVNRLLHSSDSFLKGT
jgi:methanogenic corrinoid protein MtbC1